MAENVIVCLLEQLSTCLLTHSFNLGSGLEREVRFFKDELGSMSAFLRDAEAKEDEVSEIKEWVNQVRELAYDIEDAIDEFLLRLPHHRIPGFGGRLRKLYCSIKNLRARWRISSEMKNLKARVIDISERHERYQPLYGNGGNGLCIAASAANLDNEVLANSILVEEANLVGIGAPKTELLSHILANNSHLKVIAVSGMGGLRKTTLVRKVFDDVTVKERFQIRVWLTISQTFHVTAGIIKDVIQQIFKEINEPAPPPHLMDSSDVLSLSAFVKDFLLNRSYIFVLDDVWSVASWNTLKTAFSSGNHGARIILTTRITHVASAACLGSHDHIHNMEPLSDENSWTLFCNRIFSKNNRPPPHLTQVSARILKKCSGLPLAIVTISGVLAVRNRKEIGDWEMILRSLDAEMEGSGELDRIKRIMLLSYNDLPHHLKNCLLYLSIYPEDCEIRVPHLLHSWIAQGFIQEKRGTSSYDIATLYVKQLVSRSLLQVAQTLADGTLECCRVHDILRDFIVSKSREQNFLDISVGNYSWQSSKKLRRLGIHDYSIDNLHQQLDHCFKSLRVLEFLGQNSHVSGPQVSKFLCSGTKLLKVLNLSGLPLQDIPKEVFNLFHLKHLCLQHTRVRTIPKLIGNLRNLEILDLFHTEVREMPVETFKLTKLSSLRVGNFDGSPSHFDVNGFKSPSGIGKLLSLEYLEAVEADNGEIAKEIGMLTKLKFLSITNLRKDDGEELLCSLVKLTNLETFHVFSIKEDETLNVQYSMSPIPRLLKHMGLRGHIERIPQWVKYLPNLTTLCLLDSGLKEDDETGGLGFIQELPNLVELTLHHAYEGKTLYFKSKGFQKLERLYLKRLERLKWIRVEDDESLPNLQILTMTYCKQVEELPLGIGNLKKLKTLSFWDMSDELIQKVLNLGEESIKIPQVCIQYWEYGGWRSHF